KVSARLNTKLGEGTGKGVVGVGSAASASRNLDKSGRPKVLHRALTAVLTQGTVVDEALLPGADANTLLSLVELAPAPGGRDVAASGPLFGFTWVDTSTGDVALGGFLDDPNLTQLETLLLQVNPR